MGARHLLGFVPALDRPAIDVSAAPGPVYLELWRWLNSDYTPFMQNSIDAWNGSAWVNVWLTGANSTEDAAWTKQTFEPARNVRARSALWRRTRDVACAP